MEILNMDGLPEEAKKELIEHYNILKTKYKKNKKYSKIDEILKEIENLSWDMGEKLYKTREELYER